MLTEAGLTARIGTSAVIASLMSIPLGKKDIGDKLINSVDVIRQNLAEIRELCFREETVGTLRSKLDTLFRPLLLDGITMLDLMGMTELAQRFIEVQRQFLNTLRMEPGASVTLGDYISVDALTAAAEEYVRIIRSVSF